MMADTQPRDGLNERTADFMHALAASDVDAANISADVGDDVAHVWVWMPEADVDDAESIAADHDFDLFGEVLTELKAAYNPSGSDGRQRFRFDGQEVQD